MTDIAKVSNKLECTELAHEFKSNLIVEVQDMKKVESAGRQFLFTAVDDDYCGVSVSHTSLASFVVWRSTCFKKTNKQETIQGINE